MTSKKHTGIYNRRVRHGDHDVYNLYLTTRKPKTVLLDDLSKFWGDDRDAKNELALFLLYNRPSFSFLSISVSVSKDGASSLIFEPSEKVGCAPLFSPKNGKPCASIVVKGNMGENISEVLPLIDGDIEISFSDKLILPFADSKPPMYFECSKYVDQYIKAQRLHWKKFVSEERVEHLPASSTQWTKYALKSFNPFEKLKYPNKKNLLSTNHTEWRELNYVLKMCLDELSAPQTPRISRLTYKEKVEDLRRKTDLTNITKPTELRARAADPLEIKKLKLIGNRIIHSITSEYRAWSVDFSQLFERYVQYIFKLVANQIGWHSYSNSKFTISGLHTSWSLSYLEPDILIRKNDRVIVADAKYKMHMMNSDSGSVDSLKESFRHDIHQVLAYSSFSIETSNISFIIYPSKSFRKIHQVIRSSVVAVTNDLFLIGIPWGECNDGDNTLSIYQKVKVAVDGIAEIINYSESNITF